MTNQTPRPDCDIQSCLTTADTHLKNQKIVDKYTNISNMFSWLTFVGMSAINGMILVQTIETVNNYNSWIIVISVGLTVIAHNKLEKSIDSYYAKRIKEETKI